MRQLFRRALEIRSKVTRRNSQPGRCCSHWNCKSAMAGGPNEVAEYIADLCSEMQQMQVDDASLSLLRAGGVPAAWVDELGALRGHHFNSLISLEMAVVRALGKDFPQFMALPESRRVAPGEFGHARYGPFIAYAAEGDHGEYIVVVPRAHLVAVRQITAAHGRSGGGEAVTGYADFETRVLALAQALAPDPASAVH